MQVRYEVRKVNSRSTVALLEDFVSQPGDVNVSNSLMMNIYVTRDSQEALQRSVNAASARRSTSPATGVHDALRCLEKSAYQPVGVVPLFVGLIGFALAGLSNEQLANPRGSDTEERSRSAAVLAAVQLRTHVLEFSRLSFTQHRVRVAATCCPRHACLAPSSDKTSQGRQQQALSNAGRQMKLVFCS